MDRPGSRFGHRCSCLSFLTHLKAKKLKEKVCDAFHKITGQAEDMLDEAGEKVADTGKAVVDKVADKASEFAGKADEFKGKVHTMASEVKK